MMCLPSHTLCIHSYLRRVSNNSFSFSTLADYLDLSNNTLSGTIPSEAMNRLTNLGEFIVWPLCLPYTQRFSSRCTIVTMYSHGLYPLCNAEEIRLFGNMFSGSYTCPDFIAECGISCDPWGDEETLTLTEYNFTSCRSL